jgi:hypothetical protein
MSMCQALLRHISVLILFSSQNSWGCWEVLTLHSSTELLEDDTWILIMEGLKWGATLNTREVRTMCDRELAESFHPQALVRIILVLNSLLCHIH